MSVNIGDIRYPDKESRYIVKRVRGNFLLIEMKSMDSDEPGVELEKTKEEFLKLSTSPIRRKINMKSGFAGLLNNTFSCFMNSIFQSIIHCRPLREKIMEIKIRKESGRKNEKCKHNIIENFFRVIEMLLYQTGTLNIKFFYDSLQAEFAKVDDPVVFLDFIYENLYNCGYITKKSKLTQLEGLKYDVERVDSQSQIRAIAEHSKSCLILPTDRVYRLLQELINNVEQYIILPDEQEFIILSSSGFVPVILPSNGIITIHHHRFKICSIIVRAGEKEGSIGHFYTVTWHGRYDDDNVEEAPHIMENLLKNGYDKPYDKKCYSYLFFFEKIKEGSHSGMAAEHPFRSSARDHSGMAAQDTFESSVMGHSGMEVKDTFGSSTIDHSQIFVDVEKLFDQFERNSGFFYKVIEELRILSVTDIQKIQEKKIKLERILSLLKDIRTKLDNINKEIQKLFGITQASPRFIKMEKMIINLNKLMNREIQRKNEQLVDSDEKLARKLAGEE
jgi:hypothetical protein